jgi:sugar lactone lactonase YvrE
VVRQRTSESGELLMRKLVICCVALALAGCAAPLSWGSSPPDVPSARLLPTAIALDAPIGLAEDKAGNLYVANAGSSQILVYNSKNQQLGSKTITDGVEQPEDLAFDKAGNLYASERSAVDVTVYSSAGKLIKTLHTYNGSGFSPSGVAVGSTGDTWIASRNGTNYDVGEIQVFDPAGKVIHSSSEELDRPLGVTFQGADTWVFDSETAQITVFNSSAKLVKTISLAGVLPTYASKDKAGDLYVTDAASSLIAVLDSAGKILKTLRPKGLDNPAGIAFDKVGDYYVANEGNNTITEYDSAGKLIHTIR